MIYCMFRYLTTNILGAMTFIVKIIKNTGRERVKSILLVFHKG